MGKMIWGGIFSKEPSNKLIEFMSAENIEIDEKLIPYDIQGNKAHVKMLISQGILKENEGKEILKALDEILDEWKKGKFKLDKNLEDVHMNIEDAVTKKTEFGKKMHTARSRNDQINLDMRLYMRDAIKAIESEIKKLQKAFSVHIKDEKEKNKEMEIPGYTHTRVAQPLKLSMWTQGYIEMLNKDLERLKDLYKKVNKNPLGACAIAGTSFNINPEKTAKELGFESVEPNPFATISSRGELESELLFTIALISMKLSKLSEELIFFSYLGLVKLPEEFCTGSSIMPNKKNPDPLELIRGKTGRMYGNLVNVLTVMKGTMSGHNADTQETKKPVIDSIAQILSCLDIMSEIIGKIEWNKEKCKEELEKGNAYATLEADELVKKGMSFREAHKKVAEKLKKK